MGKFKRVIENYYKKSPKKVFRDMTPSASMLGACPLASYARLKGIPETTPPDVHAMQNFEVGNITEAVIARALDREHALIAWWTDSQRYGATFNQSDWRGKLRIDEWYDEKLNITGTPDLIAKSDDKIVLVDVKTASTKSVPYTLAKIRKKTFWEESLGYKYQLGIYLLLAKKRYEQKKENFNVDFGKLIIIDKNNGSIIAEPTLFLDEALEAELINRIEYINNLFKSPLEDIPCDCASGWKKYFGVAYCNYGVLSSLAPNKQRKVVPHACCDKEYMLQWLKDNQE